MTASSSELADSTADMAAELIQAKMEANSKPQSLTHMLRVGAFHLEIVPSDDIDVEKFFTIVMERIFEKYPETSRFWKAETVNGKHYG